MPLTEIQKQNIRPKLVRLGAHVAHERYVGQGSTHSAHEFADAALAVINDIVDILQKGGYAEGMGDEWEDFAYCFNTDCNRWGEPTSVVVPLYWPQDGKIANGCDECGGDLILHNNWTEDQRQHDDGSPVIS